MDLARKLGTEELSGAWKEFIRSRSREMREILIRHYLPLVRYMAERMIERLPHNVQVDDLVSAGIFGLMEAVDRFDPERGVKFESYCGRRVQGAMLDELRNMDWVPRITRQRVNRLEATFRALERQLGRAPNDGDLQKALNLSHRELEELYRDYNACTLYSMQKSSDQEEAQIGIEAVQDRRTGNPFVEVARRDLVDFVKKQLSTKERYILMLYYQEELTMKEIGQVLELSESRVSQIHAKMMLKLRSYARRRVNSKELFEE
jgi:RNA polymerase sigma factor for flagellar operon FliA